MKKRTVLGKEYRERLMLGIDELADAVQVTLGPMGRVVLIEGNKTPITKDGVTVAKDVARHHDDPIAHMGMQLVFQAANETNKVSGDGTTTATVLSRKMLSLGFQKIDEGFNSLLLVLGMGMALDCVIDFLMTKKITARSIADIRSVATISANHDSHIGGIIADGIEAVGDNGVVAADISETGETYLEVLDGSIFPAGYVSQHFVNNMEKGVCSMKNPLVAICGHVLMASKLVVPAMEIARAENRPLLILSAGIEGDALSTMTFNATNHEIALCAVKSPFVGMEMEQFLGDIATVTGAKVISDAMGTTMEHITLGDMGQASEIIAGQSFTLITGGRGDRATIDAIVANLKVQEKTASGMDAALLSRRIALLSGGIAWIKVGGQTPAEAGEIRARVEDAINSAQQAKRVGILPGGGIALLKASHEVIKPQKFENDDPAGSVGAGWDIVMQAIKEPFAQIIRNAGMSPDEMAKSLTSGEFNNGIDAMTGEVVDMVAAGIIDPFPATFNSLLKSASVAATLMRSDCAVTLPRL